MTAAYSRLWRLPHPATSSPFSGEAPDTWAGAGESRSFAPLTPGSPGLPPASSPIATGTTAIQPWASRRWDARPPVLGVNLNETALLPRGRSWLDRRLVFSEHLPFYLARGSFAIAVIWREDELLAALG